MAESAVIVLGCYRSGTSAVAGILHHLGVFMGDRFDPPNSVNPRGFWEDLELKELFRDTTFENHHLESQIKDVIKSRCQKYSVWGFKYPEACIMMEWIDRLFKDADCSYSVISIHRDKQEICDSLCRATQNQQDFIKLVDYYFEKRSNFLNHFEGRVLDLKFPDFMRDSQQTVSDIANFVGVPITPEALNHIHWTV